MEQMQRTRSQQETPENIRLELSWERGFRSSRWSQTEVQASCLPRGRAHQDSGNAKWGLNNLLLLQTISTGSSSIIYMVAESAFPKPCHPNITPLFHPQFLGIPPMPSFYILVGDIMCKASFTQGCTATKSVEMHGHERTSPLGRTEPNSSVTGLLLGLLFTILDARKQWSSIFKELMKIFISYNCIPTKVYQFKYEGKRKMFLDVQKFLKFNPSNPF